MNKIIVALSSLLLFSSCAVESPKTVPYKYLGIKGTELNKVKSTSIGETLVIEGVKCEAETIIIEEIPESRLYTDIKYKGGEIVPIRATYKGYKLYSNDPAYVDGIAVSLKYGYACPYKFNSLGFQLLLGKEKIKYKQTTQEIECDKGQKQEFIFNGKVNNSLKFTYREFVNDYARPAFSQDLQYDLNESNIVGFKKLRIEVIKVTNTSIEYKVLSSFSY